MANITQNLIRAHRPELTLPDGRRADSLRLYELWTELNKLAIPGITSAMGKMELLNAFEAAQQAKIEALRRGAA